MHNTTKKYRLILSLVLTAILAVSTFGLAGCSSDAADDGDAAVESKGTIHIGWIPWDEDIAVTYLWKQILEDEGYEVELTQLDVAPVYDGLGNADLDLFFDAWLPVTHADYWEEYGETIEDLAVWYDKGLLTWAVPEYVEADSIGDLVGMEDTFDGKIIGIEPGSGLMRMSIEDVIPGYGLDDYDMIEGSTPAMLAELERATGSEEPVIVTLWRPHWAYGAYPIKDLKDPKGLLGEAEELHVLGREAFSSDFPEIAEWIGNFRMDDDSLAALSKLVISEYGAGSEEEAIDEWLTDEANQELVNVWLGR